MKLGVDIFSLRFNDWDAFQLLDYAKRIGVEVVHFSERTPFKSLDDGYLREVKQAADRLGLSIEVGIGSICPTSTTFSGANGTAVEQLRRWLNVAALMGSPAVRCYLGANADRRTVTPLSAHIEATIATCRAVRDRALDLGVKIAIENHAGDLQGRELAALIEQAGPDFVGACLDSGNPLWVAESPFVTLEHLAPYVVMSHIRDTAVWPHPQGAAVQWVPMGDGTIDITAWAQQFRRQCPNANFTLEIITSIAPRVLNYLSPEFWQVYQETPAHEFARFLQLVHAGRPYTRPMLTVDWAEITPEIRAALGIEQQRLLERSVRFCREVIGI
ncbi:MAG TPA: sugar phosphate isomerase/epimerase [Caldilineaceae bacterium]|nr:sugar phosphate isomerase/epimerase [Caldilineaceae bacterium]